MEFNEKYSKQLTTMDDESESNYEKILCFQDLIFFLRDFAKDVGFDWSVKQIKQDKLATKKRKRKARCLYFCVLNGCFLKKTNKKQKKQAN